MSQTIAPTETATDRIKLPFTFDPAKMLADVHSMNIDAFTYYNVLPLRAPAHTVDPSIPFPPPAEDFADGTWCDWLDTDYLKDATYINEILDFFHEHCTVNLVRLLRLEAGAVVKEHTDPTLGLQIEKSMIRLTIPIQRGPEVTFFLNQTPVEMKEGECWYLRLTDPHKIENAGATERINLTIDVIPNEWIRDIILESQG